MTKHESHFEIWKIDDHFKVNKENKETGEVTAGDFDTADEAQKYLESAFNKKEQKKYTVVTVTNKVAS